VSPLTGVERIGRILARRPVDRIGVFEHFWSDTKKRWVRDGRVREDEDLVYHFDYDLADASPFKVVVDLDFEPVTVEETEDTRVVRDGNGALLRTHKRHDATPEHLDFAVKGRKDWERVKPLVRAEGRRIDFKGYRRARERAGRAGRFFVVAAMHVFEIMKNIAGHEHMLIGMADDPDWVRDMVMTFSRLYVELEETLFAREGAPDGLWYWEDMGFKQRPFMSPAMYREIVQPGHRLTFDFAHARRLPVIVHSCGFVEPLVPGLLDAGMDCLQVIEVKAGMDLLRLHRAYGERLSFMGGIDVREIISNDRRRIDRELEAKVPVVKQGNGFVLHSDHSIPNTVDYDVYRYFVDRGLELGTYS
jgi:uroporphyrinogen decarboxylase